MGEMVNKPAMVSELAYVAGMRKAKLGFWRLVFLAILAGMFVSLGGASSIVAGYGFPEISSQNPSMQRLLSGSVFPLGLMLVVFLGAELFTGNNALLVPGYMRGDLKIKDLLRNWTVVWIGNFIGALFFVGLFIYVGEAFAAEPYRSAMCGVAEMKMNLDWEVVFVRGIGANWCVCLGIWLALTSNTPLGKIVGCWFPVLGFVMMGFEHSIANMFFLPAGMVCGAEADYVKMFWGNLLPATLGNIVGGALFVGFAVTALHGREEKK